MTTTPSEPECKVKTCTKSAEPGLEVCVQHGGGWPQARRKSELVKAKRALDAFIEPIPADDPEALDPLLSLEMLRRKTISRIRFLERVIAERLDIDSMQFGTTKVESTTVGEYPGVTQTIEARVPVLVQLLRDENATLVRITELEAKNHFKAAELALKQRVEQQGTAYLYGKTVELVKALGRKPDDPRVRRALAKVFAEPPG